MILLKIYIIGAIASFTLTKVLQIKGTVAKSNNRLENILFLAVMGIISWYGFFFLLLYKYWKDRH